MSNYFRTRAALLIGVVERILERELPEVGSAFSPASVGENVDALCALFAYLTGPNRVVTTARLAHVIPSPLAPPSPPAPKDCSCTTSPGTTTRTRGRRSIAS
jgi:hypothetical protein